MTLVEDMALMIERFCNREHVEAVEDQRTPANPHGLVDFGFPLDYNMFIALTPTCSLVERELILAALPTWAQRQIQSSVDQANAMTDRITNAARRGRRHAA